MEISDPVTSGLPDLVNSSFNHKLPQLEPQEETHSPDNEDLSSGDSVSISKEARKLHRSEEELKTSKQLLNFLPDTRAHVIYEALAKLKAGHYSSEKIISEAVAKLLEGDETTHETLP